MRNKLQALAFMVVAVLTVAACVVLGMHLDAQRRVRYEEQAVRFSHDWVSSLLDADENTINGNITTMLKRTDPAQRDHVNDIINANLDLCRQNRRPRLLVSSTGIMAGSDRDADTMRVLVTTRIDDGKLTPGPMMWLDIVAIDGTPDVSDLGPL